MTTNATETAVRSKRMNMRLTPEAYDTIRHAAELQQQDLTSFAYQDVVSSAGSLRIHDFKANFGGNQSLKEF